MRSGSSPESSHAPVGVWVVEPHAVLRRGLVAMLSTGARPWAVVAGDTACLADLPTRARLADNAPLSNLAVLVCPAQDPRFGEVSPVRPAAAVVPRVLATVRDCTPAALRRSAHERAERVLDLDDLTSHALVLAVAELALHRRRTGDASDVTAASDVASVAAVRPGRATGLTDRERQVLQLLADGEDTRAIAVRLRYSERTVKAAVHDALDKLGCRTRAQAVGLATRTGLI